MSKADQTSGIDDLLPGLASPLWEGTDEAFAEYVHESFGTPATMTHISITPPGRAGRSAVAIDDVDGGLLFALTPNPATQQTHIRPIVCGPLTEDADVVKRAKEFSITDATHAITGLAMRHLPVETVRSLLMAAYH